MTTPGEREEAQREAADALNKAEGMKNRGMSIGERWRKAQEDNNFRQMLRQLGSKVSDA